MAGENLTEQQRAFISQFIKKGLFKGSQNKKTTVQYEAYLAVEATFKAWVAKISKDHPEVAGFVAQLRPALDAKNAGDFKGAVALLAPIVEAITAFGSGLPGKRTDLIAEAGKLDVPDGADKPTADAIAAKKKAVGDALPDAMPTKAQLDAARKLLGELAEMVKTTAEKLKRQKQQADNLNGLEAKNPKAGKAAREAFAAFDAILKGEEPTEANIKQAQDLLAQARTEKSNQVKAYNDAKKLPEGQERTDKMKAAFDAYKLAETAVAEAEEKEKALLGQKYLSEAIAHGPLSGETGRPLDDASAELIAKGFQKNPRMAHAAVGMVNEVEHPELVAQNLDKMMDRAASRMKSDGGTSFNSPEYAETYATSLLKMGGSLGADYFAGLDDYLKSGAQFASGDPLGDSGAATFTELAQKRSVKLAGALVGSDGGIDVAAAKGTLDHMMYHPDAMRNATPAMNAQMLKTVKMLGTEPNKTAASDILKGATAPTGAASKQLVQKSLGKADTDPVSDTDTRTAIMASMLKPLDQGPVGSCFTTAPARRMRETDPIKAMQAMTDVATKSKYKPEHGVEVPVITNIPPGEDPIMRSWEYTLATSAARAANASEKSSHDFYAEKGLDTLKTVVGNTDWATKLAKLSGDISAAFIFVYNPVAPISGSSDGSSTSGRYVLTLKKPSDAPSVGGKGEIFSKADYQNAIADLAIKSLGVDPTSADATKIRDHVKTSAFMDKVSPDDPGKPGKKAYEPWELAGGGQTLAATQTLFGATLQQHEMIAEVPKTGAPDEGPRTKAMLEEMLDQFSGKSDAMITIRTVGQHGFNALPNHPSLAALKGTDKADTANKVDKELIQPGQALKNTDLDLDRAQWLFDKQVKPLLDKESDATVKAALQAAIDANRPSAALKPAGLAAAVKAATDAYNVKRAEIRAEKWKTDQSTPPSQSAIDAKKAEYEKSYKEWTENDMKSALAEDMGAPEFVIADSNWGDSRDHTYFVIAPDPTSGEPILWKKAIPPGSLSPAGRDWVDHEWASIE